jgi:predicted transcriptional regulator
LYTHEHKKENLMEQSTTLTIRLNPKVKAQLGRLAASTDRSKSWLAAKALADYVARESQIVASIKQGLAEVRSGNAKLIPHAEAMAQLRATINRVARRRR